MLKCVRSAFRWSSTFSGILDTLPPAQPFSYTTGVVFEVAGEAIGELIQ